MNGKVFSARLTSLTRRYGLDHNPLRRRSDRIEVAALWTATMSMAVWLPVALLIGFAVFHQNKTISAQQYASRHNVAALLIGPPPVAVTEQGGATVFFSDARWSAGSAGTHVGQIQVPPNTAAESVVHIWTNDSGAQVAAPLTWGSALGRGAIAAGSTIAALGLLLWGSLRVAKWRLNRRRFVAWEREWQHIDPHLSR